MPHLHNACMINILGAAYQESSLMMATELPLLLLLLLALVLLCHLRDHIFAGLADLQEVLEVEAHHHAYLAHPQPRLQDPGGHPLDPHPAHYLQFHLRPAHYLQFHLHPDLKLHLHPDPDLKLHLHLVLPWYQLNQLIDLLYKPV